jgi:hypothetical protein
MALVPIPDVSSKVHTLVALTLAKKSVLIRSAEEKKTFHLSEIEPRSPRLWLVTLLAEIFRFATKCVERKWRGKAP